MNQDLCKKHDGNTIIHKCTKKINIHDIYHQKETEKIYLNEDLCNKHDGNKINNLQGNFWHILQ